MKKLVQTVNIHQAKTQLSKLIDQGVHGEPFLRDPFDRLLVAQAIGESVTLLAAAPRVAQD